MIVAVNILRDDADLSDNLIVDFLLFQYRMLLW